MTMPPAAQGLNQPAEIFVVDDEAGLRGMIEDYLTLQKFSVSTAESGDALDRLLRAKTPDLIVLDVNMPGENGLSIVARLRAGARRMGVIMLTANGEEASKLAGLDAGADDYVVKPFELRELLARIRSVLRRLPAHAPAPQPAAKRIAFGAHMLDLDARCLLDADGRAVAISAMEFELLGTFARHPRQILSRERLCSLAHGRDLEPGDRSVDIRVARLRKKLEAEAEAPKVLHTVRGEGYVYEPA